MFGSPMAASCNLPDCSPLHVARPPVIWLKMQVVCWKKPSWEHKFAPMRQKRLQYRAFMPVATWPRYPTPYLRQSAMAPCWSPPSPITSLAVQLGIGTAHMSLTTPHQPFRARTILKRLPGTFRDWPTCIAWQPSFWPNMCQRTDAYSCSGQVVDLN